MTNLYDRIMYYIFDSLLDDCWQPYAGHRSQAQALAFYLTYVVMAYECVDDEPTIASKPRIKLPVISIGMKSCKLSF